MSDLFQLARDALLQLGIEISPRGATTVPEAGMLAALALAPLLLIFLWLRWRAAGRPAAEDEKLRISSKVLKLATAVY